MDTYKLKFTRLQARIFELLCIKSGEKLSQRQIAIYLKVSPTAVAKALFQLSAADIVIKKRERSMNLIMVGLNRSNQKILQLKRIENLKSIYSSRLLEFLEDKLPGTTIILFGSYSRGEDTINSDIDIAIIGRSEKFLELKCFESVLERRINLNFYISFDQINKELKENLCNGIVLAGGVAL